MEQYVQKLHTLTVKRGRVLPNEMVNRYYADLNIINKPFHFKGTSDTCVILVHGWTSTPYEMRVLGKQLNAEGFGVDAPLLSGHGTRPEDLENVTWQDWQEDVHKAFKRVKKQYKKVYIGGMSLGGSLSLHVASNVKEVDGLILMSTPYKMRHEKMGFCVAHITKQFVDYKKKYYPRVLNPEPSITQLISYQRYPISSAFEAFDAIKQTHKKLHKIEQPTFLIQPQKDHLIAKSSVFEIYKRLSSQQKEMRLIRKASHNFMGNGKHKQVFDDVVKFVKEN
jgi:carboxylesterase